MDKTAFTNQDYQKVLSSLNSQETGLTVQQVVKSQQKYGLNEIKAKNKDWFFFLARQFNSPLILILLAAAVISFFLSDRIDSLIILIIILINTFLGFFQEFRSQKELQKLKAFVSAQVTVRREGELKNINKEQLTVGDILILNPGDIVSADARVIKSESLVVDESVLTGESVEKSKNSQKISKANLILAAMDNAVLSGTTVKSGYGEAVVFAIAESSEFGKITKLSLETVRVSSFEQSISRFSSFIVKIVLITLILTFIANILIKGATANIIELFVFTVALAVSVIPEALPAIITLTLSRGAIYLARKNIIVKRLTSLEDLGHIEVLCTDKTGTITKNELSVVKVISSLEENDCLKLALLVDETQAIKPQLQSNPFDVAIEKKLTKEQLKELEDYQQIWKFPFDPVRKRTSSIVEKNKKRSLVTKGAPEDIINSCRLTVNEKRKLLSLFHSYGQDGYRVIAVAQKEISKKAKYSVADETLLQFIGLICFSDPLKPGAKAAILLAEKLNVKIKILTGDSSEVAGHIAYQVGIISDPANVITGEQIAKVRGDNLRVLIEENNCFARVTPEQKYIIIQILQNKYSVGFLGEGINDAPALKLANASLVVENASDVAREAADIILVKKDLGVIVDGIKAGREIFTNIDKYIKYTLIGNFGNFYAIAGISLIINFLPILPLQILLVNLLTDTPALSMSADNVDLEEIKSPKKMVIREITFIALVLGITSSIFDFIFYATFKNIGQANLQTLWFTISVLADLILIYSIRTQKFFFKAKRPSLVLVTLSVIVALITLLLPQTKIGREVFHFAAPTLSQLGTLFIIVASYFVINESVKLVYYRLSKTN